MLHARIGSNSDATVSGSVSTCNVCCCESLPVRAGATEPMVIDYSLWSVPIAAMGRGLGCSPQFNVEPLTRCPEPTGDDPFIAEGQLFEMDTDQDGMSISGDLAIQVTPSSGVEFSLLPFHGPFRGTVTLDSLGAFTYTALQVGPYVDRFFVKAKYNGQELVFEVVIGIDQTVDDTDFTPAVRVLNPSVSQRGHFLKFGLQISPALRPCDSHRLRVRMDAYDCDGTCFWNDSCFDLEVGNCR